MPSSKTIYQELIRSYKEAPERVAVRLLFNNEPELAITFHQLISEAAVYAQKLSTAGIMPGEVVVLILQHGPELIYSFFGAILQGAIPSIMPFLTEKLDPSEYNRSIQALFEITKPAAVITYPEFLDHVKQATNQSGSIRSLFSISEIQYQDGLSVSSYLGSRSAPDQIVLLQHSSGTTGLQKGVALSHRAVFNQLHSYANAIHLSDDDVIASWLPLYHDMGLIAGFILPILKRVPLVLLSPLDWVRAPYKLMHAITRYKGTLCWLPNFAYNFLSQKIRSRDLEGVDLSSLRAVINCSEPMYWESHQMFFQRFEPFGFNKNALATSYAMAENVFAVTQGGIDNPITIDTIDRSSLASARVAIQTENFDNSLKMLSAGRPIENTSIRIMDANSHDLPDRQIGEIAIQSNCMLSEYYHRPNLTQKSFIDGWYLTGDYGYTALGELFITGRKKDLIIVGGKNIYPQDLEMLAGQVDGVYPGRTVAFGVFNLRTGTEEVVIIAEVDVLLNEHRQRIADEIREKVTRASEIALRNVYIVDRGWINKTSSGKIARSANRQKYIIETGHV